MELAIPVTMIAIAAVLFIVLRKMAEREQIGQINDEQAAETWPWPEWPVTREAGDRQPRARRYEAERSDAP